ncbi:MAG: hypothetical protein L6V84_07670 [Oscillospiraceae bacterium]|nr:MAG: hypothetical protein L6V84_07670 [Oscillospiraceae bacterium]
MGNRSNRQRRKILKGVGYAVVGVTAGILLALLIRGTRKPSDSVHTGSEGRIGDVWIGDACYEKRRDLKKISSLLPWKMTVTRGESTRLPCIPRRRTSPFCP